VTASNPAKDCCVGEPAFGDPKGLHTADCPVYLANMDALERMQAEPADQASPTSERGGSRPVTAPDVPEIGIESPDCIQVVMAPSEHRRYRRWLAARDLHLYLIPGLTPDDLPTYAIGIGADR